MNTFVSKVQMISGQAKTWKNTRETWLTGKATLKPLNGYWREQ